MKKVALIILMAAGLFIANPGTSSAIPVTNAANGHTYDVITQWNGDWDTAYALVSSNPLWTLATITDANEQAVINTLLNVNECYTGEFWLGGYQFPINTPGAAANWQWVTGEAWAYSNWTGGEPNDNTGSASEQYLAIWGGSRTWNDEGAVGNITGFIIETAPAPVPEPGTMLLIGSGLLGLAGFRKKMR